jgi:hypothetical protein
VELDLVDAVPVPVVADQARFVPVRLLGPALRLRRAGQLAQPVQIVHRPAGALAVHRLEQRRVGRHVVIDQGRGLVEDLVRHETTVVGRGERHRVAAGTPRGPTPARSAADWGGSGGRRSVRVGDTRRNAGRAVTTARPGPGRGPRDRRGTAPR